VTLEILLINLGFNSDLCVAERQIYWVATPKILSISLGKVLITSKALGVQSGLQPDPRLLGALGLAFNQTHQYFAFLICFSFFFSIFFHKVKRK
jgi:hypothetical protein